MLWPQPAEPPAGGGARPAGTAVVRPIMANLSPGRLAALESYAQVIILVLIWVMSFSIRLFAVVRYESVIHEYDPYFNYRATSFLVDRGFYDFVNWIDSRSWYPLGRIVGQTVYPGLMGTAALLHWGMQMIGLPVNVRNTCVFLAPAFSGLTACSTFLFTSEVADPGAGLLAAFFIGIAPAYTSRSVAGSYDNEGVAIFAMINTFYFFVRALRTGSLGWSVGASLAYFYMVSTWGGYTFIINIIPLFAFVLMLIGRYSVRLYIAYSTFYVLGTFLSMQVFFVGFQAVQTMEHMPAMGVFALIQVWAGLKYVEGLVHAWRPAGEPEGWGETEEGKRELGKVKEMWGKFQAGLVRSIGAGFAAVAALMVATGYVGAWTGRSMTLLDPTYASKYIPIIASVSEHQPTVWSSYFMDLHMLVPMMPVGLYFCFQRLDDGKVFVILYALTGAYFSGVMVRMMLIFCPIVCVCAGIGLSRVLRERMLDLRSSYTGGVVGRGRLPPGVGLLFVLAVGWMLYLFVQHAIWCTSEAYSSPSIMLSGRTSTGARMIFDDFREGYRWMAHNLPRGSKVMSWWDYGYQLSAMANKDLGVDYEDDNSVTVLVDNNTWNNTHIASVGAMLASTEAAAWKMMRRFDVQYVMVVFGGYIGYSSDDINKFMWPVRIGAGVFDGSLEMEGMHPSIVEEDFYKDGSYRVDEDGAEALHRSLLYKLAYNNFAKVITPGKPLGWDRVRGASVSGVDVSLDYMDEVYTSENWIIRIYKVRKCEGADTHPECNRGDLGRAPPKQVLKMPCIQAADCQECMQAQDSRPEFLGQSCVPVKATRKGGSTCEAHTAARAKNLEPDFGCLAKHKAPSASPQGKKKAKAAPSCGGGAGVRGCAWCGERCHAALENKSARKIPMPKPGGGGGVQGHAAK